MAEETEVKVGLVEWIRKHLPKVRITALPQSNETEAVLATCNHPSHIGAYTHLVASPKNRIHDGKVTPEQLEILVKRVKLHDKEEDHSTNLQIHPLD